MWPAWCPRLLLVFWLGDFSFHFASSSAKKASVSFSSQCGHCGGGSFSTRRRLVLVQRGQGEDGTAAQLRLPVRRQPRQPLHLGRVDPISYWVFGFFGGRLAIGRSRSKVDLCYRGFGN